MEINPPPGLFEKIIKGVRHEKTKTAAKKWLFSSSGFFVFSAFLSYTMWGNFQEELTRTGFAQYLSLLIYDFQSIKYFWQDFGLTLLETLPFISLAGLLGTILAAILSLRSIIKYGKSSYGPR